MEQGQDAVVGHRLLKDGCAELFPSRLSGMQEHGPHFGLHGQAMGAEVNLCNACMKGGVICILCLLHSFTLHAMSCRRCPYMRAAKASPPLAESRTPKCLTG
jgi:hypothetical protein